MKVSVLPCFLLQYFFRLEGVWVPGFELARKCRSTYNILLLKIVIIIQLVLSLRITANYHIWLFAQRLLLVGSASALYLSISA